MGTYRHWLGGERNNNFAPDNDSYHASCSLVEELKSRASFALFRPHE